MLNKAESLKHGLLNVPEFKFNRKKKGIRLYLGSIYIGYIEGESGLVDKLRSYRLTRDYCISYSHFKARSTSFLDMLTSDGEWSNSDLFDKALNVSLTDYRYDKPYLDVSFRLVIKPS